MAMRCERGVEREKELEVSEQREKRLKDKIDDWVGLIDDQTEEPSPSEFEKTLRMPVKGSRLSH
jgi:hypothetical protein